jgi:acetyl esterase/lipase
MNSSHLIFLRILMIAIICRSGYINAQDLKLELYNDESFLYPISKTIIDEYESDEIGIFRKKKIAIPSIEIYYPDEEFKEKPAFLILPGGGYSFLSYRNEGLEIVKWLNKSGYIGVILNHRLPDDIFGDDRQDVALSDAKKAMELLKSSPDIAKINTNKIGVIGFSAGGHLAGSLSVFWEDESQRPDLTALIYPVISMEQDLTHRGSKNKLLGSTPSLSLVEKFSLENQVSKNTPKAFLIHSSDDKVVNYQNSLKYYDKLIENGIEDCEIHIFPNGNHGYGLAKNLEGNVKDWSQLFLNYLNQINWMP